MRVMRDGTDYAENYCQYQTASRDFLQTELEDMRQYSVIIGH